MSFERTPCKSLSPGAIARLVGGRREFLAFLERRVGSRAAAEDILQSAFARGLERGPVCRMKKWWLGSIGFYATP